MFALCRPKHHGSTPRGTPGNLRPNWPTPCWFERRRHSIANCSRMVTDIAQRSQWRAYRKPPSLFRMVPSLTPYDLPFPQMAVPYVPNVREWPSLQRVMSGSRVYGFQGRRIEWRYFRWHQIQVGGRPPSWIISNGHIFATANSIHLARNRLIIYLFI